MICTEGTLLGGRVHYAQPEDGYRTGIEPVLLAASVPAGPGDRILEGGTGAGAALLCLAARVPSVGGLGVERDAAMAALARDNFAANGFAALETVVADLESWQPEGIFDHAMANPPWHDPAGTASDHPGRRAAKHAAGGLLGRWAVALGAALRPRGTLSLIVPAAHAAEAVQALAAASCPEIDIVPLWIRAGQSAKLIIARGRRLGGGPCRMLPGLVLHADEGGWTAEANAILRDGKPLRDS